MGTSLVKVSFPGGKKVSAQIGSYTVTTDQPPERGGTGSAPTPFQLFLASIGTCAGYFVLSFCEKRGIPMDRVQILQHNDVGESGHLLSKVRIEIRVPADFPEEYRRAVVQVASQCSVKQSIAAQPEFTIETTVTSGS